MISISIFANMPPLLKQDLDKADSALEIEEMAKIYSLSGNRFGISIENLKIGKPTKAAIKNMKLLTPSDKFALSILDVDKKEIFLKRMIFIMKLKIIISNIYQLIFLICQI